MIASTRCGAFRATATTDGSTFRIRAFPSSWDQLFALSGHLEPAYEALHEHVLSHRVVGADETTWRLMTKKGVTNTKRWQITVIP